MSDSATLELIKREFGTRETVIELAFESSESFRVLCGDFRDCLRALERFRVSDSDEARVHEAEYSELLWELTGEIEARLQAVGSVADVHSAGEPPPKVDD
ncbi:MAG: hypothetical protein JSU87_14260 [Gemmatimonadota bacterium]|nr:MAG: hypothetical protein JSU87_14260 [Gemmatimonadota bacterium]